MHFCNSMTIVDEKFREIKFKSKDFYFYDFLYKNTNSANIEVLKPVFTGYLNNIQLIIPTNET